MFSLEQLKVLIIMETFKKNGGVCMRRVLLALTYILLPGIIMALGKVIIDPLFLNQKIMLDEVVTLFVYGLIAGVILLVLRLVVKGGSLT